MLTELFVGLALAGGVPGALPATDTESPSVENRAPAAASWRCAYRGYSYERARSVANRYRRGRWAVRIKSYYDEADYKYFKVWVRPYYDQGDDDSSTDDDGN